MQKPLLSFFCLLLPFAIHAQIGFQERTVIDNSNTTNNPTSIFSGDLDGDGDLDVIASIGEDDKIVWYENLDGKGNLGQQNVISSDLDEPSFVYTGDIDGDGDIDVLSASKSDNKIAWYENIDGNGNFGSQRLIASHDAVTLVFATDIDDDGDLDVVFTSNAELAWSENTDGTGSFGVKKIISEPGKSFSSIFPDDIDNDGDIDIFATTTGFSDTVFWYRNEDGNGTFGNAIVIDDNARGAAFVQSGDIDADGDKDIIVAATHNDDVLWYENSDGLGTFVKRTVTLNFDNVALVHVVDVDGDSDLDVIAATAHFSASQIIWYENTDGLGTFSLNQLITDIPKKITWIDAGDMDGDGDIDLLQSSYEDNELVWYENGDGLGDFGPEKMITRDVNFPKSVLSVDIDGDGDKDIVSASDDSRISWYENENGRGAFGLQKVISTGRPDAYLVTAADLDQDNDNDLLAILGGYPTNTLIWFENLDGKGRFAHQEIIDTEIRGAQLAVADIDGDTDNDLISLSDNDKIVWFENTDGLANFSAKQVVVLGLSYPSTIHPVDMDNDGDIDVSYGSSNLRNDGFHWVENIDGLGNFGAPKGISQYASYANHITSIDVDNDGDMDIIGSADRTDLWENIDGKGNFAFKNTFQLFTEIDRSAAIDMDGDGDLDIVDISDADNRMAWYENRDGTGNDFSDPIEILSRDYISVIDVSDIDNDGDADILLASLYQDKISWLENLGMLDNEINGAVRIDLDANGCDTADQPYADLMIVSENTTNSFASFTDSSGNFKMPVGEGDFVTSIASLPDFFSATPLTVNSSFSGKGNSETIDFCISQTEVVNDLGITIVPWGNARAGSASVYRLIFKNSGNTELSGSMLFQFDSRLDLVNSSEVPSAQTSNSLTFDYTGLGPFETRKITLTFDIPPIPSVGLGDILHFDATIDPVVGDQTPSDNTFSFEHTVIGSYDPNDITVLEGDEVHIDNVDAYLNYVIRFQNTGTASAIDVRIDHELDPDLDWETFMLTDSSHDNETTITDGKDVEFLFEHINLPDSTANEPASHGHVAFKIKPKTGVFVGDVVHGSANIFFDSNPPIVTNTVSTQFVDDSGPLTSSVFEIGPITCAGADDAQIQVEATGGIPPYRYELLDDNFNVLVPIQANNSFTGLGPGNYRTRVIDSNNETSETTIAIAAPAPLGVTVVGTTISCHGAKDGQIELMVTGGGPPYYYQIDGGGYQASNVFENLSPGVYMVETSDANGCSILNAFEIVEPEILTATATVSEISCKGSNDGSLTIRASGGTAPYEYSLGGASFSTDNSFTGLSPGHYDLSIRDANGCSVSVQATLTEPNDPDFDNDGLGDTCDDDVDGDGISNTEDECPETPLGNQVDSTGCDRFVLPSANFTVQTTSVACTSGNNGSILVTAVENLDYTATLSNEGKVIESKAFRTFASFRNLMVGNYDVCVTVAGQVGFERCFSVQITAPEPLDVDSKIDTSDKSVTLKMKGGFQYTIDLNGQTHTTFNSEITLPITASENHLSVKTDKDCQGEFEETFFVGVSTISIYPNPVQGGEVTVLIPQQSEGKVQLSLFTNTGKLVQGSSFENTEGPITLDVSGLTSGVYNLKIEMASKTDFRRIVIK